MTSLVSPSHASAHLASPMVNETRAPLKREREADNLTSGYPADALSSGWQSHAQGLSDDSRPLRFPSPEDTLAYVDALRHSDLSQWRSLEQMAARAGRGNCEGALTTSVLTALYLLGLYNLCSASPISCCLPPALPTDRRKRHASAPHPSPLMAFNGTLTTDTLSTEFPNDLPRITRPNEGLVPVRVSVVEQVRKLWNSNPRLLSNVECRSATESVRSSFISLSGVASGIILAYSVAQLNQCYPDLVPGDEGTNSHDSSSPKIWFFPITRPVARPGSKFLLPSATAYLPIPGEDEPDDGCERSEVVLEDGRCASLLSSVPCPYRHWVLLNKYTRKGECVPRLCGDGRVFVEEDQMCHDVEERGICPDTQRLYLDAYGMAICDCPDGMFPGPNGHCHLLYDPAYCAQGTVLQFHEPSKTLMCAKDPCDDVNSKLLPKDLPFAPRADGHCYQFNKQGPCSEDERFGFNTENLRAQCVSLLEAGLIRPKRSYMYHHRSYQSSSDQSTPHYEVSYVILNGSTWGLEVKGVSSHSKRQPREANGQFTTVEDPVHLPFIDTREIPSALEKTLFCLFHEDVNEPSLTDAIRATNSDEFDNVTRKVRSDSSSVPDVDTDDGKFIACHFENDEEPNYKECCFVNDSVSGKLNYKMNLNKTHEATAYRQSLHSEETTTNAIDFSNSLPTERINHSISKKEKIQKLLGQSVSEKIVPNASIVQSQSTRDRADSNFVVERNANMITDASVIAGTLFSTSFVEPVTIEHLIKKLLTPRLRIIDTLSHPRRLKPRDNMSRPATFSTNFFDTNRQLIEESTTEKEITTLEDYLPVMSTGEIVKVGQDENSKDEVNLFAEVNSTDVIKVYQEDAFKTTDHTEELIVSSPGSFPITETSYSITKSNSIRRRGDITVKHRGSQRRRKRRRNSSNRQEIKPTLHHSSNGRVKQRTRGSRRHQTRQDQKNSLKVSNSDSSTMEPKKLLELTTSSSNFEHTTIKEPVATVLDCSSEQGCSTQRSNLKTNAGSSNRNKKLRRNQTLSHRHRTKNKLQSAQVSDTGQQVTDLMRHRDRRQLAGGGGIIQAPLLSACKPGAKRDYNYKCRPKFIPQHKALGYGENAKEISSPVPPRIKCPKGTSLDPRGKCQASSNLLG